jgi:hypothetical protein
MKLQNKLQAVSLIGSYVVFAVAQLLLLQNRNMDESLYKRVVEHKSHWETAHIVAILGVLLLFPALTSLLQFMSKRKGEVLSIIGIILIGISVISLVGQYAIDFSLTGLFTLPENEANKALNNIQSTPIVKLLFYDMAICWVIGQLLLGIGLVLSKALPKWSLFVFLIAFLLVVGCSSLFPLIARGAYILFSIAFIPIAMWFWKGRANMHSYNMLT